MAELNRSKSTLLLVAAGTGTAVLGAAICFQCLRAQPGTAAEEATARASASESASGKARLGASANSQSSIGSPAGTSGTTPNASAKGEAGARVSHNGQNLLISMDEVAKESVVRVGKEVLDSMINRAIIQLACRERGVEVARTEVDQEIVRIAAEFKIPVEQYLQMLQAERNIPPEQYRRDVIWPMLALKKLVGAEVKVTEEEIQKAFEREYGPRVKCRMILCDNLRRAQAAWAKVKESPDDFEKYVQEYSIDPASKSLDGSVPPIPRHSGSETVEKAAFKLKMGEISAVIQIDSTLHQYVILKCEGRTDPVVKELDDQVRAELADLLKKQKTQEQVAKVFESIKKETRVDNYYTNTSTGGTSNASQADGTKSNGTRSASTKGGSVANDGGEVRQAGAKGTSNGRVKPAIATSADDADALPVRPASSTKRSVPNSSK